jgi:hypothetical protein
MQSDKAKFKEEFGVDPEKKKVKCSCILDSNLDFLSLSFDVV